MTGVPVMRRKSPAVCVAVLAAAMLMLAGCGADRAEDLDNAGATSYTEPPLPAEACHRSQPDTDDYRVVHQPHREPAAHPRRRISAATHAEPRRHPRPRALIVGLDTGSNLMSFRDPATGRLEGFDVDIAREIARDLLGDPEKISTES
ncbi:hypothetical protein ACETU7_32140 [Rhodococcus sp. 3Y1]